MDPVRFRSSRLSWMHPVSYRMPSVKSGGFESRSVEGGGDQRYEQCTCEEVKERIFLYYVLL